MSETSTNTMSRKALERENLLLKEQLESLRRQCAVQGEQLANLTERHSALESKYDLECLSREEMVEQELQKRMAEERREERERMDKAWKELEQQKADARKELETMLQNACAKVEGEYAEKMEKALLSGITQVVDMLKIGLAVKKAMLEGGGEAAEAELERFRERLPEARRVLEEELREALEKVEKKGVRQAQHIAELVRMVFTRKSERVELTEENRETLIESVIKSLELTEEQKKDLKQAHRTIKEHRERLRTTKTLEGKGKTGHGRKPIPDSMPRLAPITLYPEGYEGHEDEYRVIGKDVQEFILPVSIHYVVQPIERPVVVRKDDPTDTPRQSSCYEGPIWKSNASAELLAQLECGKYLYHMPFYRLGKKMKAEGFDIADSTLDGWHREVCRMLEPLYEMQHRRVMQSRLLAADGSPMPVLDDEKKKTTKRYIIQYRSIDTGIPIFLYTPGTGSGRKKEVIEANLMDWTGSALMCDAYSGYDWVGKTGRALCRCAAHARRKFERAMDENPNRVLPVIAMLQDIYTTEDMAKKHGLEGDEKTALRRRLAGPYWELIKLWCGQYVLEVPEDTLTYEAMTYLLRHYEELTAYLGIARMPIDNNDTEREIRAMVMGRKAYLYCRTEESCQRAAMMYSLLGACKVLGKNPEKWLAHTLKHIGSTKPEDLHRLLPEEWTE